MANRNIIIKVEKNEVLKLVKFNIFNLLQLENVNIISVTIFVLKLNISIDVNDWQE